MSDHISDIQLYRDMAKNPDKYNEGLSQDEAQERDRYWEEVSNQKKSPRSINNSIPSPRLVPNKEHALGSNFDKLSNLGKNYEEVVNLINNFGLKEGINNAEEELVIENRKKLVFDYLKKILKDVENYIAAINHLSLLVRNVSDSEDYRDNIERLDQNRRDCHNRLINDLKIAVRLINVSFNKSFSEDLRFQEERKYKERESLSDDELKNVLSQREYVEFSYKNGAIIDWNRVPKEPEAQRNHIKDWAASLYVSLTDLESDINEMID